MATVTVQIDRRNFSLGLSNAKMRGGRYNPENKTWALSDENNAVWMAAHYADRAAKMGWIVVYDEPETTEPVAETTEAPTTTATPAPDQGVFADCGHHVASAALVMQGAIGTCCPTCYDHTER